MRHIHQHAEPLHLANDFSAKRFQPVLLRPVCETAERRIICEWMHRTNTDSEEVAQRGEVSVERSCRHTKDDPHLPTLHRFIEITASEDQSEIAISPDLVDQRVVAF